MPSHEYQIEAAERAVIRDGQLLAAAIEDARQQYQLALKHLENTKRLGDEEIAACRLAWQHSCSYLISVRH